MNGAAATACRDVGGASFASYICKLPAGPMSVMSVGVKSDVRAVSESFLAEHVLQCRTSPNLALRITRLVAAAQFG